MKVIYIQSILILLSLHLTIFNKCNKITSKSFINKIEKPDYKKFIQKKLTPTNNAETINKKLKISNQTTYNKYMLNYTKIKNTSLILNKNNFSINTVFHKNSTTHNVVENYIYQSKTIKNSENNLLCDQHCYKISQIYGCYCDPQCKRYIDCCELYLPECI